MKQQHARTEEKPSAAPDKTAQPCIHNAGEFGTFDNITGKCWVCGKTYSQTAKVRDFLVAREPGKSTYGVYIDGDLWEGGYVTQSAAYDISNLLRSTPNLPWRAQ